MWARSERFADTFSFRWRGAAWELVSMQGQLRLVNEPQWRRELMQFRRSVDAILENEVAPLHKKLAQLNNQLEAVVDEEMRRIARSRAAHEQNGEVDAPGQGHTAVEHTRLRAEIRGVCEREVKATARLKQLHVDYERRKTSPTSYELKYSRVTGAAAVLPAVWIGRCVSARLRRRHVRVKAGLCAQCGYDLRASKGRCPECGNVIRSLQVTGHAGDESEES